MQSNLSNEKLKLHKAKALALWSGPGMDNFYCGALYGALWSAPSCVSVLDPHSRPSPYTQNGLFPVFPKSSECGTSHSFGAHRYIYHSEPVSLFVFRMAAAN